MEGTTTTWGGATSSSMILSIVGEARKGHSGGIG